MVKIIFNGQPREAADNVTIADLLEELHLTPRHVAVELNMEVVPRELHGGHILQEGDQLEVVTLVGGG